MCFVRHAFCQLHVTHTFTSAQYSGSPLQVICDEPCPSSFGRYTHVPGDVFGVSPSHLSARLAYVEFDGTQALQAAKTYGDTPFDDAVLEDVFGKTKRGIEHICDWASAL